MTKIKNAEVLSLDTTQQKQIVKETKLLKKQIKDGTITVREARRTKKLTEGQHRGLIFISHLPHGFYEEELKKYFQQFGKVTNVVVCRSGKTGNSKGYGYIEFFTPDVAKIAAETMNNYLMFKKRITANFVPYEKRPKGLFMGKPNTPTRFSSRVRREKQYRQNLKLDPQTHLKRTNKRLSKLNKKLVKLQQLGIKTTFTTADIKEVTHIYETDPFDSDIEVRVPLKKSKKSIKSAKSLPPAVKNVNSSKSTKHIKSLVSIKSVSEVNITTPKKKIKKTKQSKGITKKSKKLEPLNTETVRKIARELIKKRGKSLLQNSVDKTKTSKKSVKK